MTTYNVRCSWRRGCGKHFTKRKRPDGSQKCPVCKRGYLNDASYSKVMTQKRTCRCRGIEWPHKKGLYLNVNEFCDHAEVDLDFEGSQVRVMKPDDPVPF